PGFVITQDAVGRVSEPDGAIGLHDDAVRRVQPLAPVAIREHGDAAVVFRAGDASRALLTGHQPSLPVASIAVAVVGRVAKERGLAGYLVVAHHAVVR